MRSLKAQLMGMVSGKSQKPCDSIILSDSATHSRAGGSTTYFRTYRTLTHRPRATRK